MQACVLLLMRLHLSWMRLAGTVYIDRSDFREEMERGYRRLAPGQPVGLKYRGYAWPGTIARLVSRIKLVHWS